MKKLIPVVLVAVLVAIGFWFFPQHERDAHSPLAFAPEDTPFVIAAAERAPEPIAQLAREQLRLMGPSYAAQFRDVRRMAQMAGADPRLDALLDALEAEFAGQTPDQVLSGLGIDLGGRFALYGQRLVPVLRVELEDPALLPATVLRLEGRMGETFPSASVDGQDYWRIALGELEVDLLVAVADSHLVVSTAPTGAEPAVVAQLLGVERPSRSLGAGGALHELQRDMDYHGYFSGYVDAHRLVDALYGPGTPAEAAFLGAFGIERPTLTPQCRGELQGLADSWPRLSFGYTRLDAGRIESRAVLETRTDIAEGLMTLRAPMAGPAAAGDASRAAFGVAYRLSALPTLVNRHVDAVRADPWQCPQLQPLNAGFDQLRAQMANPALFMAAPLVHSVYLSLDSLAMPGTATNAMLPEFTGLLAIGSENPASLLAMAQAVMPQLASIGLQPDGQPRALPLADQGLDLTAQVAMGESALALAVGDTAVERLPRALEADATRQPVWVFGIDSAFYAEMLELMLANLDPFPLDAPSADQEPFFNGEDDLEDAGAAALDEHLADARRDMEHMVAILPALFERVHLSLELSERGIEFIQQVDMP